MVSDAMFCGLDCICSCFFFFFFFSSICRAFFLSLCPSPSLSARPSALLHESTYLSVCSPPMLLLTSLSMLPPSDLCLLFGYLCLCFCTSNFYITHLHRSYLSMSMFLCIMTLGSIFAIAVLFVSIVRIVKCLIGSKFSFSLLIIGTVNRYRFVTYSMLLMIYCLTVRQ